MTEKKIVGYSYKADLLCPMHALVHAVRDLKEVNGLMDLDTMIALGLTPDDVWEVAAMARGIKDRTDLESYDSDDFPKPFTAEQAADVQNCSCCGRPLDASVDQMPYTVVGLTMPLGTNIVATVMPGPPETDVYKPDVQDGVTRWVIVALAESPDEASDKVLALLSRRPAHEIIAEAEAMAAAHGEA